MPPETFARQVSAVVAGAMVLGLGQDVRYSYERFPDANGRFHKVIVNEDGSYKLVPSDR